MPEKHNPAEKYEQPKHFLASEPGHPEFGELLVFDVRGTDPSLMIRIIEVPKHEALIASCGISPAIAKPLGEWLIAWAKEHGHG
jgi:hypothetical protein